MDGSNDPDLTEEGKDRAERIATYLSSKNIDGIYSTGYKRTIHTAQPTADLIDTAIQIYDPRDPNSLNRIIAENLGKRILIIGHSNTVPMMVNYLAGEKRLELLSEAEYENLYRVEDDKDHFVLDYITYKIKKNTMDD